MDYTNCASIFESNAKKPYSAPTMQPSVLPSFDKCGDSCQGRRRRRSSSPYGVNIIMLWSGEGDALPWLDMNQDLLHTYSDSGLFSDANTSAVQRRCGLGPKRHYQMATVYRIYSTEEGVAIRSENPNSGVNWDEALRLQETQSPTEWIHVQHRY